jgi:hypothetical protein
MSALGRAAVRVVPLLLVGACARETPPPTNNGYPQQYPPQQYPPQQYPPQQYPPQQRVPPPAPPPPAPANDLGQTCVDSINRHRATLSLPPLARWRDGEACTSQEAQTDGKNGAPHGSFGACKESAQNVCPGWPGPPAQMTEPCVQSMWDEGPGADFQAHGHYLNMVNKAYRAVACGYSVQADGSVWLIQNFVR